jgi:ribonuclease P protein component
MRARAVYTSLRRRAEFSRVHQQGRRKGDALLQVRVLPSPPACAHEGRVRLGIIVSKKFGGAVARNRFKRIVRAALCTLGPALHPGWDILVLPREGAAGANSGDVAASLRTLLGILGVLDTTEGGET